MKSFAVNKNQYFVEDFLVKYVKTTQAENKYLDYSLKPDEIKYILMKCPEFLSNIDYAIEFLIRSNDSSLDTNAKSSFFSDSNISFNFLQNKLLKHQILAKNRISDAENQNDSIYTIKKLESVMKDNHPIFFTDALIYSYSTLIMISRSSYDTKGPSNSKNLQMLNKLVDFYNSYSIQSNFSPINTKSIKRSDDDTNQYNPLFTGIPSGSPNIHRKGIASNGYFLFVLHSDMFLTIFPISSENGGFLSPFMCKLVLNSSPERASLSFTSDNLVITTNQSILSVKIQNLVSGQINSECPEIQCKIHIANKDSIFVITDGVVNVTISQHKELLLATVKSVDSQKEINQVALQKNPNFDDFYKIYPFDNSLLQWPVETNGIVLSFYIKIDQTRTLCRQFSLIDGSHLRDEMIETTVNISSITYDSINQMHYVAIDNNGQLMVHALSASSDCCVDPFIFGFKVPDFSGKKDLKSKILSIFTLKPKNQKDEDDFRNEKEFVYLFSSILLSSIFLKKDIETFIIEGSENILLLPFFIIEIANIMHSNEINNNSNIIEKDKDVIISNIQLASIQALAILFVINVRHFYLQKNSNSNSHDDHVFKKIEAGIIEFIMELSRIKEPFSMNIISYIILNLFDLISIIDNDDNSIQFQAVMEGLLISSSSSLLNYIIHVLYINSDKFSTFSFTNANNIFKKYIENDCKLSEVHPNIISFLLCHQRCVINQVHRSMEKDHFSAYLSLIIINNDCKTDNESLNNFGEYTNFLVNQFSSSMISTSSFEELQKTTIYFLFLNYLSLIAGLYNYNEIAQIVTPLLHITQNSLKEFFERKKVVILKNFEAQNILIKIGLAFGAFTGTLIKGGNYSEFDEKYKWLIRPNMNLISHPDLLYELDNPKSDVKTYLDENVKCFLSSEENELNGKSILQKIYKKWNVNMNKNLKSPLLELDQLFFAVELYHLHLFDELNNDNIDKLRPALQQMMRVRNSARAILRSSDSSRKVSILEDDKDENVTFSKKSDGDELTSYYSPFDLIVIKSKMLLRMKSKFDDSNISNAPKLLADFVLSPDQPTVFINYISNQQNRLQLTNVGFSLIEAAYSLKINSIFIQVIDTTLSIVVDNFDGLSAIIQYDSSHKSEKQISNFLLRALKSMESPYLALVIYKLMKSEALSNETIGKSIELVLPHSISNNKLFGLCYKRFGYISNILTDSNSFLFSTSGSDKKKTPLISLPVDDFDKISPKEWFIISDVLTIQQCNIVIYQKILQFFLNFNDFHRCQAKLQYVSRCIYSFYEKFDSSYSLNDVKKDFHSLLTSLAKSIAKNENLERASEIVTFFRKILILCNQFTLILNEIFKYYETNINCQDYDDILCAIFAVLGGYVDIIKPDYPLSFRMDRENVYQAIFLDQNTIIKCPVNEETKPINIKDINIYAEPSIPFNWCMFPNFSFIIAFLYYATENTTSKLSYIYLNSLSYYLKEESFYGSLLDEHIEYLIQKVAPYMNPFDNYKDTQGIISHLLSKKKIKSTFKDSNFSILSNDNLHCTTYLSPVLKLSKTKVFVEFNEEFNGYFGLIADCPLDKQFPYALIHSKTGAVYPGFIKNNKIEPIKGDEIEFSVDAAQQKIIVMNGQSKTSIQIPQISYKTYQYKIFICVFESCKVESIRVQSNKFLLNYKPKLSIDDFTIQDLIRFPAWTNCKTIGQMKSILMDDVNNNFHPLTEIDLSKYPLFEMIDFKYVLFRFDQAGSISTDLIDSIIDHVYLRLLTQISTVIMMYIINNGFGELVYNYKSSLLIKLFSYIQIPLEPFDAEKLASIDFPFLFNESILNEDSLVVYNQQFNGMEIEMKNCLSNIKKLFKEDDFINELKSYIEKMGNDPRVHTLRNTDLNVLHYDLFYCGPSLTMNFQFKKIKSILVSTSYFNNFLINSVEKITPTQRSMIHFPFIFDTDNNDKASIDININQLKNNNKTISCLLIDGFSNHWVFGTSFELLLLLKEFYLISHDSSFVRKKMVEWILIDSPFISIFLPKMLINCSQESFMSPSDYKKDYLQCLLCLSSLISSHGQNIDQNLPVFLFQEKRALNSNFQAKIAHLFPEFYVKPPSITHSSISKGAKVSINLPDLDIPTKIGNPMTIFMLCKSFISKRKSIQSYPYWELLPVWLSVTLNYCNEDKSKRKEEKSGIEINKQDDISIIRKSDGFYEIQNPFKKKASMFIDPSTRLQVKIGPNSCFILSDTSTFDNPFVINALNIFEPIDISGEILYLSSNNIDGPLEFVVELEGNKKATDNSNKGSIKNSYEFDPSLIHDDFVNDIQLLINNWSDDETSELLSVIPPFLFQQTLFQPLVEIALTPDMRYNSMFSPRIVLIVTFIVHRINYLHFSHRGSISTPLWRSVNHLISFDEAAKQFFNSIVRNKTKRIYIDINRFEAHRMAIERTGSQSNSVICQMSKLLALSPTSWRSTDMIWHVDFYNEAAIDVGGPSRELFTEISMSIFEPTSGLFILSPNGRSKYGSRYRDVYVPFHFSLPHSRLNEIDTLQRELCYRAIGVFLGIVMRIGFYQDIPFAPIVWKLIAGEKIDSKDVLEIDQRLNDFFMQLRKAARNKDETVFNEQFNSRSNRLTWTCENWDGSSIKVDNPTKSSTVKREHVNIYITNCIKKRVEVLSEKVSSIRKGFYDNIGFSKHQFMSGKVISFLAQGSNIITTAQLKKVFLFPLDDDLKVGSIGYNNFWAAVDKMSNNQRSLLLKFITALTRLPNPAAMKEFVIKVSPLVGSKQNYLPQASTCFNTLYLPVYTTPEIAFRMITTAIESCQTMEKS